MHSSSSSVPTLDKVKSTLYARGSTTIRSLAKTFKDMDSFDGNKKVDRDEFLIGLKELGVDLTKSEADALLSYFDKDGDGFINFDEFLVGIRGKLNGNRQNIVDSAFKRFDKDGNGTIDILDLKGVYDASNHPKVKSGEKTAEQVFMEFLQHFGDRNKDGRISRDEWNDYYAAVSSSIDNDEHFVALMKNAWKLE